MKTKENIYLDLSKLSGEEIKEVSKILTNNNQALASSTRDLFFDSEPLDDWSFLAFANRKWSLYKMVVMKEEIDLSEFCQLFSYKGEEVLQVENKINIDELTKLCNEYNRSNLKISNLKRDLEYKNNWSEKSVAIQEIKQQISILQKIKETVKSKLQDIGIEF